MRNAVGSLICKGQKSRQSENGKEFLPKHRPPSRASPPPAPSQCLASLQNPVLYILNSVFFCKWPHFFT